MKEQIIFSFSTHFFFRIDNDIAILKLSRDVSLSDYVVPACLPSSTATSYTGQQATVSGKQVDRTRGQGSAQDF